MREAQASYTALEHEAMHQETLLYMWHRLPYEQKRRPRRTSATNAERARRRRTRGSRIPAGRATLGADRERIPFGWDNEFAEHRVDVPAFDIDALQRDQRRIPRVRRGRRLPATGAVDAGGVANGSSRSVLEHPAFWIAARRRSGSGAACSRTSTCPPRGRSTSARRKRPHTHAGRDARLPTEAEYHRAAFGDAGRRRAAFPVGRAPRRRDARQLRLRVLGARSPVGSHPAGASAWGVHDLVGNGWEWTSTMFAPFDGFRPMASYPEYSADFFDGQHYVMKGGVAGDRARAPAPQLPQLVPARTTRTSTPRSERRTRGQPAISVRRPRLQ